jgi:hypothetical protein
VRNNHARRFGGIGRTGCSNYGQGHQGQTENTGESAFAHEDTIFRTIGATNDFMGNEDLFAWVIQRKWMKEDDIV